MCVTAQLAQFVADLEYETIPRPVVEHMKLCLLDSLGCGLFGSTLPWGNILAGYAIDRSGPCEATLWGRGEKVPVEAAVLVNGTCVHGFELDDLHPRSILHPGAVTIPVVLALAEARGKLSGKDALVAMIAGYEVGVRVGMAIESQQLRRGFHPTGTLGPFAAAAAAAKVIQLPVNQVIHSLGIAGSQGAGLMAAQYSSMVKRMHAGRAAQSGVYGAVLAERGFTGITNIVEAEYGGFGSTYADKPRLDVVVKCLGDEFETLNVGFKPYCCCGSNHTSLDAIKYLFNKHTVNKNDIESVRIFTTKATKLHVGWPYQPDSITSAQMNLYYCIAVFLCDGEFTVDQFNADRLADPRILAWINRIEVIHDPQLDALGVKGRHAVRMEIKLKGGERLSADVKHAWGSAHHPMSVSEVKDKFMFLAGKVFPGQRVNELLQEIENVASLSNVTDWLKQFRKED